MVRKLKGFSARHVKAPRQPGFYQVHSFFTFRNPKTKTLKKAEGFSFFFKVGKWFRRAIRFKKHGKWRKRYKSYRYYTYKDGATREVRRTTKWKKVNKMMKEQSRISALDEIKKYDWETAHVRYHYLKWVKKRKKKRRSS